MDINSLNAKKLAKFFDHTELKADATDADFKKLCDESKQYGFCMVAINPAPVELCSRLLEGTGVNVGAAIGYPLGQETLETKVFSTEDAIKKGANEIDYVINVGRLKDKDYDYLEKEMSAIVEVCKKHSVLSKVIFENCYLTKDEIVVMAKMAKRIKPDFIKTSTGMGTGGALVEDVKLMKEHVGEDVKVKAAGGIRTLKDALAMIEAGAERLGASASVTIMEEYQKTK